MAKYFAVLLNFPNQAPTERLKSVFNKLKDWVRFHPESWLVYTELKASEVRDRLKAEFLSEDPSILVIEVDTNHWSAYAKDLPREWLRQSRDPSKSGE